MLKYFEKFALIVMAGYLLKISMTGELGLLIHPRYFWMTYLSIPIILALLWGKRCLHLSRIHHILLGVLCIGCLLGLVINLQPLSSFASTQEANLGNVSPSNMLRARRMSNFGVSTDTWEMEDWIAMLSINPEPKNYQDQHVGVTGFYHIDTEGTPMVARYTLSCCAADARVAGLYLSEPLPLEKNTWVHIEGVFQIQEGELRRAVVDVEFHEVVEAPRTPYIIN